MLNFLGCSMFILTILFGSTAFADLFEQYENVRGTSGQENAAEQLRIFDQYKFAYTLERNDAVVVIKNPNDPQSMMIQLHCDPMGGVRAIHIENHKKNQFHMHRNLDPLLQWIKENFQGIEDLQGVDHSEILEDFEVNLDELLPVRLSEVEFYNQITSPVIPLRLGQLLFVFAYQERQVVLREDRLVTIGSLIERHSVRLTISLNRRQQVTSITLGVKGLGSYVVKKNLQPMLDFLQRSFPGLEDLTIARRLSIWGCFDSYRKHSNL